MHSIRSVEPSYRSGALAPLKRGSTAPSSSSHRLSSAAMRYLLAIYRLSRDGSAVRSVDISHTLNVSPASVVHMTAVLSSEGMVQKQHYGRIRLTGDGIRTANQLYTKSTLLESFLVRELSVHPDAARQDALSCLCILSEESIEQIARRVLFSWTPYPGCL